MRKPAFCKCENKDADQLRGNREADQRLCFRHSDSTIPLLPKFQASSHLLWSYSPVCVGPGRKPRRPAFSQRGSYNVYMYGPTKQTKIRILFLEQSDQGLHCLQFSRHLSRVMRKPAFCICENKDADQLRSKGYSRKKYLGGGGRRQAIYFSMGGRCAHFSNYMGRWCLTNSDYIGGGVRPISNSVGG